jgi:hypothetical protein
MYSSNQIMKKIINNNKNKKKLVAITAAVVTIMLVVSVGTIGAAPFSGQQQGGLSSSELASGPGVPGGGFELQLTERKNSTELPRIRGEFTVRVQCNPDEVVSGGGFAASLSPQGTSPTGIPKESRMFNNGWEVHWDVAGWGDGSSHPQYAPAIVQVFAECLKVVNEGTTG